jgi:hypothetical protein
MYPSTRLIPHLSNLPAYGSYVGTLVNVHNIEKWNCGHVHNFSSTALECAEYQKTKILRGGK